ncbi:MAG: glycosyltransferase [Bacteroidota bacterium]
MEVSVVIVNYNVRPFLENALNSLRKALSGIDAEIIVVDNASTDGSIEMLRSSFPEVMLIINEYNAGFGAANNTAMKRSTGRFILLLNPDTIVQEDTVRVMIKFFGEHAEVGIAGCKVLNPDGTLQLACRRSFPKPWVAFTKVSGLSSLFQGSPLFGRYNLTYKNPNESYEVDAISGSFMFLRREVYVQTNGFDEEYFMYGEDLDLCYRVQKFGWKVYYVHSTQIIHYKGESARRSDIDEVKIFYEAMYVFVNKHLQRGVFISIILRVGIGLRKWFAFVARTARPLKPAIIDAVVIDSSFLLGEYIWFGNIFHFPGYAYPIVFTVPWCIIASTMLAMGLYTTRKYSLSRAMGSVIIGYIILSALVFFFKQYGFSRMVVLISGFINLMVLPGWRLFVRAKSPQRGGQSIFGRRTLIVGVEKSAQEVLRKLRTRVDDGYDVIGFIDLNQKRIGEKISGLEILGSIDNISKVAREKRVSEVIFSMDVLSYTTILSVIAKTRHRSLNYRLVPNSMEVIIGKTHIDELDDIPLIEIEYNIHRPLHRLVKRVFDIMASCLALFIFYPWVWIRQKSGKTPGKFGLEILLVPDVFRGILSFVGPPFYDKAGSRLGTQHEIQYWGRIGLTGLAQINNHSDTTAEDIEKYNFYYAKNQTLWLDLEIIMKSILHLLKH